MKAPVAQSLPGTQLTAQSTLSSAFMVKNVLKINREAGGQGEFSVGLAARRRF
jgi:hypothetical protein